MAVRALASMAVARTLPLDAVAAAPATATEAVNGSPDLMPDLKAELLVERSRVLAAAGLAQQARTDIDSATILYERKGNVAAARQLLRA